MKKIYWLLVVCTIICLVLAVFQYQVVSNQISELTRSNNNLANKELIQSNIFMNIINCNTDQINDQKDINLNSEGVFLLIEYPICEACFKGVTHQLDKYTKNRNQRLILLCKESYVIMMKKMLQFEGLGDIDVQKLNKTNQFTTKMTIIFRSNSNNLFYLPLPENMEVNFVETFLKQR